jgi:hypothetical protein
MVNNPLHERLLDLNIRNNLRLGHEVLGLLETDSTIQPVGHAPDVKSYYHGSIEHMAPHVVRPENVRLIQVSNMSTNSDVDGFLVHRKGVAMNISSYSPGYVRSGNKDVISFISPEKGFVMWQPTAIPHMNPELMVSGVQTPDSIGPGNDAHLKEPGRLTAANIDVTHNAFTKENIKESVLTRLTPIVTVTL